MPPKFTSTEDEILINCVRDFGALFDAQHEDYKNQDIKENIWEVIGKKVGKHVEDCKKRWKSIRDNYLKIKKNMKTTTGQAAKKRIKWCLFDHLIFLETIESERSSINTLPNTPEWDQNENREGEGGDDEDEGSTEVGPFGNPTIECHENVAKNADSVSANAYGSDTSTSSTPAIRRRSEKRKNETTLMLLEHMKKRDGERRDLFKGLLKKHEEEDDVDVFMKSIALTVKKLPTNLIARAKVGILNVVTELQLSETMPPSPYTSTSVSSHSAASSQPTLDFFVTADNYQYTKL